MFLLDIFDIERERVAQYERCTILCVRCTLLLTDMRGFCYLHE